MVVVVGARSSYSEVEHGVRLVQVLSVELDAGVDSNCEPRHIVSDWHWVSADELAALVSYCAAVHDVIALHCPEAKRYCVAVQDPAHIVSDSAEQVSATV